MKNNETVTVSVASEKAEAYAGVLIAFFAAIMSISELVNNDLEEQMMVAHNKHNNYFSWYQSKSVKQSLKESELATLEAINLQYKSQEISKKMTGIKSEISKYKLEKNEIMKGSSNVPPHERVQDLDGKMGAIIGVKEWETEAARLEVKTRKFDIASLFYQISLVLGAVCVIIYDNPKLQKMFIGAMITSGVVAIIFSLFGYFS